MASTLDHFTGEKGVGEGVKGFIFDFLCCASLYPFLAKLPFGFLAFAFAAGNRRRSGNLPYSEAKVAKVQETKGKLS